MILNQCDRCGYGAKGMRLSKIRTVIIIGGSANDEEATSKLDLCDTCLKEIMDLANKAVRRAMKGE